MFFCKKSRNSCLLIFVRSMSLNTTTVERILFFDFFTIFCEPFLKLERILGGGANPFPCRGRILAPFPAPAEEGAENFRNVFRPGSWHEPGWKGPLSSRFMPRTGMNAPRGHPSRLMPITGMNDPKWTGIVAFSSFFQINRDGCLPFVPNGNWTGMDENWGQDERPLFY